MDSIPSFSGGSGGVILIPNSTLPLEWKSFTGQNVDKINKLNWITATETGTDYFELERSADGINFEGIILVQAAGNSNTESYYNWNDENPIVGFNYYRLKLWNLDGTFEYSNVIAIEVAREVSNAIFYPNPTSNIVTYSFDEIGSDNLVIEVFDAIGKKLSRVETTSRVGLNTIDIDLSEFASGNYSIKVTHLKSKVVNSRIIIKK
jgi:hypothetical protein